MTSEEKVFEVLGDLAVLHYCGDIAAADPQCRLNPEAQEIDLR